MFGGGRQLGNAQERFWDTAAGDLLEGWGKGAGQKREQGSPRGQNPVRPQQGCCVILHKDRADHQVALLC